MRSLVCILLLTAIPSYSQCYDPYSALSNCRAELEQYEVNGLRAPRSVVYGASRERSRDLAVRALEDVKSSMAIDSNLIEDFTKDRETNKHRRELSRQVQDSLQRKIDDTRYNLGITD